MSLLTRPVPRRVLLVEGESDAIAVRALARRLGLDLAATDADVIPMGGVTNLGHHLAALGDADVIAVLHDVGETPYVDRTLARAGDLPTRAFACDLDLEDELIRSLGVVGALDVVKSAGDLGRWRTLTRQPFHLGRPETQVLRRFIGTTSGRKARYAQLLVDALDLDQAPTVLAGALVAVTQTSSPAGQSP